MNIHSSSFFQSSKTIKLTANKSHDSPQAHGKTFHPISQSFNPNLKWQENLKRHYSEKQKNIFNIVVLSTLRIC